MLQNIKTGSNLDLSRNQFHVRLGDRLLHFSTYGAAIAHLADNAPYRVEPCLTYGPTGIHLSWADEVYRYTQAHQARQGDRPYEPSEPPELRRLRATRDGTGSP